MNIRDIEGRLLDGSLHVRYHNGVGFMQAYLTENVRLHVWHPELPGELEAFGNRHDHRFDFESTILLGKVVDTRFVSTFTNWTGTQAFDIYSVMPAHLGSDMPRMTMPRVGCQILPPVKYVQGDTYQVEKGQFHESRAEGLTVTILRKSNQSDEWARILAAPSQVPEHGMARKPAQALLDQLFFSALRKLPIEANEVIDRLTKEDAAHL